MEKRKINALIAAGCVAMFAPSAANADVTWGPSNDVGAVNEPVSSTPTSDVQFRNIFVTGNTGSATFTVDTSTGSVTPGDAPGAITLTGSTDGTKTATLQLTNAVNNVTANSTNVVSGNNYITQSSGTSATQQTNLGTVTIQDGANLTVSNSSSGAINATSTSVGNNSGLTIQGNKIVNMGSVTFTNAVANVSGLKSTNYNSISYSGNNTINATNSDLGDVSVNGTTVTGMTVKANDGDSTFTNATLASGRELTLYADGSKDASLYGTKVTLNGTNTLNTHGDGAITINEVDVAGTNTLNNYKALSGTTESGDAKTIGNLKFTSASTVTMNGDYNVTEVNQSGTDTIIGKGDIQLGTIKLAGNSQFNIDSQLADKTITIVSVTKDSNPMTLNLNASVGNITLANTAATALIVGTNDKLYLAGNGDISVNNLAVNGGFVNNKANASFDTVTIGTSGLNTSSTPFNQDVIKTDNLVIDNTGTAPTWNLDAQYNVGDNSVITDKFQRNDGSTNPITVKLDKGGASPEVVTEDGQYLDFNISQIAGYDSIPLGTKFVKYVQLVDADKSILKDTYNAGSGQYYKTISGTNVNYSYLNTDPTGATKSHGTYAPNTVKITNYEIGSNKLVEYITDQGDRILTNNNSEGTTYAGNGGITALPNMEARRDYLDENGNLLTLAVAGKVTGYQDGTPIRAQMFNVDTSVDGIQRSLDINGGTYQDGLADASRMYNTDNGAAIRTNSNNYDAPAEVSFTKFEPDSGATSTFTPNAFTFTNNEAKGEGGAFYNHGLASTIRSEANIEYPLTFTNNVAGTNGGAISNDATVRLESDTSFIGNRAGLKGGAIYNAQITMPDSSGIDQQTAADVQILGKNNVFEDNVVGTYTAPVGPDPAVWTAGQGGAIYNTGKGSLVVGKSDSTTTFRHNEALGNFDTVLGTFTGGNGGAIASVKNDAKYVGKVVADNNIASGNGGFYYATDASKVSFEGTQTFQNNVATGKGGAIYADKESVINIAANGKTVFSGNKQDVVFKTTVDDPTKEALDGCGHVVELDSTGALTHKHVYAEGGEGESNAIYLDGATLNLSTSGNGSINFNDKIANGELGGTINQKDNSVVYYNTDMTGFNGTFNLGYGAHAYFTDSNSRPFAGGDYNLAGGSNLHLDNGVITTTPVNSFTAGSYGAPANMSLDLVLSDQVFNCVSDKFVVNNNSATGFVNVNRINAMGTSNLNKIDYDIIQAPDGKFNQNAVQFTSSVDRISSSDSLYDYDVTGRLNGITLTKATVDPAHYGPQVAVNARLAGQLDMYNQLLHRVDEIAEARYFNKQVNKTNLYAADPDVLDDRRIDNKYTPYVNQQDGGNVWVKPNFTIESIRPVGIDKYSNKAYNTFIGYEMPVATLRNGWDLVNTVFGGYQGSYQSWDGARNIQNGGSGGYMANLYRKNFFTGGVVMLGGSGVNTEGNAPMDRSMNFGLFDAGAAARVGYNVGLGKHWLLQPMLTASYIFITGLNGSNNRDEHYDMKTTHTVQVAPGLKLVGNYNGWQPYLVVDYTWPFIAKTVANVNDMPLEDLKLRSYIEYGVGLRKNFGDRFSGNIEAIVRNIGRTGVSLQGGLVFKF